MILYHHERVDGLGYPMGLRGEEIPMGSRILAVIDAFQAMTTEKAYRAKLSVEEALTELRQHFIQNLLSQETAGWLKVWILLCLLIM